ncbi:MAG: tetratricopeptide repeat protein, partial [Pseudomonadales bacterium]
MKLDGSRLLVLLFCCSCSATSVASNSAAEVHPSLVEQLAGAELAEANEDFETARKLYLSIIEEIDRNHDGYDSVLIGPLVGLGRTYQRLGDPLSAEEALKRAQHLIHRTEGVHALSQLEIVELMTEVNLRKGEPFDADTQQKFAMHISERNFEATSDLLPSLTRLATWYTDTGQFYHANKTLER